MEPYHSTFSSFKSNQYQLPDDLPSALDLLKDPQMQSQFSSYKKEIKNHSHDMVVLDLPALLNLWRASRVSTGTPVTKILDELKLKLDDWSLESMWEQVRSSAEFGATWAATALDATLFAKLAADMARGGNLFTKYKINHYNGKQYIIFKGNLRARQIITGTRYLVQNTKVVNIAIGKAGVSKTIASGGVVTLFLVVTFRALDTLMKEEATWHYFIGALSADLVKLAISVGVSYYLSAVIAGSFISLVIGPLFIAIAVGIAMNITLNELDKKYGFTDTLIKSLHSTNNYYIENLKKEWRWHHRSREAEIEFWMRATGAY